MRIAPFVCLLALAPTFAEPTGTGYTAKNQVVAVVNGGVITMTDVRRGMPDRDPPADVPRAEWLRYRLGMFKQILDTLVERKLLSQEAKLASIDIQGESLEAEIDRRWNANFKTRREFLDYLKKLGVSMREFRQQVQEDLMAREIIRQRIELDRSVSPSELMEFYNKNLGEFSQGEKRRLRIIMVPEKIDDKSGAELARELVTKLRAKPDDFAMLAKKHSIGPANEEGGDIGWVERDKGFRKELREVGFSLKKGAISDPIPLAGGYFIIKAENISPGLIMTFDEAQPQIRGRIQSERYKKDRKALIDDLKSRAYIVTFLPDADLLM